MVAGRAVVLVPVADGLLDELHAATVNDASSTAICGAPQLTMHTGPT